VDTDRVYVRGMNGILLTGLLACTTADEADRVARHLPQHVLQTQSEPGYLSFDVTPTADPMVWTVAEHFADEHVFRLHQDRAAGSDWGRMTAGIERR
jgi:quinol monooxygenase YgiN